MILRKHVVSPPEPALTVDTPGGACRIALRRLPGARRLTLRVRASERDAVLTLPAHVSLLHAQRFAEKHAAWLGKRLSALPEQVAFAPGNNIPLRGIEHALEHRPAVRGLAWTESCAEGSPRIVVAGGLEHFSRRLGDFLKREARTDLETAVDRYCRALEVKTCRLRLGDPISRWGSCSQRGALSFSWRLVMAPPHVLDYLAAHEVAHRREMNHGPRFWSLVERLCPDYERAETWLKHKGASLHRYGARSAPDDRED
jgi:predicted metal-dependent hydrolase